MLPRRLLVCQACAIVGDLQVVVELREICGRCE